MVTSLSLRLEIKNENTDTHNNGTYRAGKEMAVLELPEKECNEEAPKHQAHGEQGGVGVRCQQVFWSGTVDFIVLLQNMRKVVQGNIQFLVVENQRMGLKDLHKVEEVKWG